MHGILYLPMSLVVLRVPWDTWQCIQAAGKPLGSAARENNWMGSLLATVTLGLQLSGGM